MYLYFFEDGQVGTSIVPPLPQDFEAIDNGVLLVVRCVANKETGDVDIQLVNPDGELEELPKSECESDEQGEYHFLPPAF